MLELDDLRNEIAERGLGWNATRTRIATDARRRGGGAFLGVRIDPDVARAQATLATAAPASKYENMPMPPTDADWRNRNGGNYVTPVRSQGPCGACVAFATCASAESRLAIADRNTDPTLDLSEAGLYFCSGRRCATGWWPEEAMDRARTMGLGLERSFPYTGRDSGCRNLRPVASITGWDTPQALRHRKQAIAFNGPVVAVMKVYEDFMYYESGVYEHAIGEYLGLHSFAVIGYNDIQRAWIIKNSWDTIWGESGFGYVKYGQCGIDTEYVFWDPIVEAR